MPLDMYISHHAGLLSSYCMRCQHIFYMKSLSNVQIFLTFTSPLLRDVLYLASVLSPTYWDPEFTKAGQCHRNCSIVSIFLPHPMHSTFSSTPKQFKCACKVECFMSMLITVLKSTIFRFKIFMGSLYIRIAPKSFCYSACLCHYFLIMDVTLPLTISASQFKVM